MFSERVTRIEEIKDKNKIAFFPYSLLNIRKEILLSNLLLLMRFINFNYPMVNPRATVSSIEWDIILNKIIRYK